MEFRGPLEGFFKSPDKPPNPEGDGILYNLRVDLEKVYGKESEFSGDPSAHAMLAMTGILVGIDYLSQCYYARRQSGKAFVETLLDLGGIDWDNAEAIYQLRCALLHSFSLTTISERKSFRRGSRFNFKVVDDPKLLIALKSDAETEVNYRVGIWGLKRCFLRMIAELKIICSDSDHPKHSKVLQTVCERAAEKLLRE